MSNSTIRLIDRTPSGATIFAILYSHLIFLSQPLVVLSCRLKLFQFFNARMHDNEFFSVQTFFITHKRLYSRELAKQ